MTGEEPKKGGRKKKTPGVDVRFYILLSADGDGILRELCSVRGGYARAKSSVVEEALRRMHADDTLLKMRRPKRKAEEP